MLLSSTNKGPPKIPGGPQALARLKPSHRRPTLYRAVPDEEPPAGANRYGQILQMAYLAFGCSSNWLLEL